MNAKQVFLGLTALFLTTSCDPDSNGSTPLGAYEDGILVVNEGNDVKGTISYIAVDGTVVNDLVGVENPGINAGSFVQSVFFDGEKAFIISNGSNKITVVNRYTFKYIGTISSGLVVPRYGVVVNGKAYVTNLNTFGSLTDDFVTVIDAESLAIEKTVPMNALADRIIANGSKVYVSNGNYGAGSTITIIDANTNTTAGVLNTDLGPNSLEAHDGNLYVLCGSYTDDSSIYVFDLSSGQFSRKIVLAETMDNAQNLDVAADKLFFTVDSKIYSAPLTATTVNDVPLFTSAAVTLYGFAVDNDKIYVADARDFSSNGKVFVYSLGGLPEDEFTVGLNPNGFYFN